MFFLLVNFSHFDMLLYSRAGVGTLVVYIVKMIHRFLGRFFAVRFFSI